MNDISGVPIVDTAAKLAQQAFFTLKKGDRKASQVVSATKFSPRKMHQVVSFKNKLWLIGGADFYEEWQLSGNRNDVWSSVDGIGWAQETVAAAFSPRHNHRVIVFNDKLWLIGGISGSQAMGDVWSSGDGVNWTQVTANAPFGSRSGHQLAVLGNKLFLIGGIQAGT